MTLARVDTGETLRCPTLPCTDVAHGRFTVPDVRIDPDLVRIVMVSEAPPAKASDCFYAGPDALFAQTTVQAFRDAGAEAATIDDLLALGVYLTTAVKCGKTGYAVSSRTVQACSVLLEAELARFPRTQALMLMGDVAIKGANAIARRNGEPRIIPAGSTYRLRGTSYFWRGMRVFPSYVQSGPAFFVEKSKRRMIAEDIAAALAYVRERTRSHS
jgi:uracil-DNA glycosylase